MRKQDKPEPNSADALDELRENAEAQAAMFHIGADQHSSAEPSSFDKDSAE